MDIIRIAQVSITTFICAKVENNQIGLAIFEIVYPGLRAEEGQVTNGAAQQPQGVINHARRAALEGHAIERNEAIALRTERERVAAVLDGDRHHRRRFRLRLGGELSRHFTIDRSEKRTMGLSAIEDLEAADRRPFAAQGGVNCGRGGRRAGRETGAAETKVAAPPPGDTGEFTFHSLPSISTFSW